MVVISLCCYCCFTYRQLSSKNNNEYINGARLNLTYVISAWIWTEQKEECVYIYIVNFFKKSITLPLIEKESK